MTSYPIHTIASAPAGSRQSLHTLHNAFGLVPNLAATMAGAPSLVNTFVAGLGQFAGSGFAGAERQVLLLSNAVANNSTWPVAFHSTMALKEGVARTDIDALRGERTPGGPRLAALSTVTRRLIETRGHLDREDVDAFLAAGFDQTQLLDVVTGVALSAMANYTANVADPELEPPFQAEIWSASDRYRPTRDASAIDSQCGCAIRTPGARVAMAHRQPVRRGTGQPRSGHLGAGGRSQRR